MKDNEDNVRITAHRFWLEAGKPEGLSDYFWYKAEEYYYKPRAIYENLKLPVCPKCCDTKDVEEMDVVILCNIIASYPWFRCKTCGIKWHAKEGIREKEDARPCFS